MSRRAVKRGLFCAVAEAPIFISTMSAPETSKRAIRAQRRLKAKTISSEKSRSSRDGKPACILRRCEPTTLALIAKTSAAGWIGDQ